MNKRILKADILLLLTAAIWGFGFVAQRSGMQYVGPFAFNGVRFILGSLSLLPLIAWRSRNSRESGPGCKAPRSNEALQGKKPTGFCGKPALLYYSFIAGTCLFIGVSLQQLGLMATTAGNAGFITGLYVVLVPIFGIFLRRKTGIATWIGALFTFTGLYFLSSTSPDSQSGINTFNPGDILIAVSSLFWALHVLIIDRFVQKTDAIKLSSGQFAFAGFYALAAAFLVEPFLSDWMQNLSPELLSTGLFAWKSFPDLLGGIASGEVPLSLISSAMIPILYGGIVSVGAGYTLQAVGQKDAPPAHATIILCLEGCFAALGGVLLLSEPVGARTIIGFAFMLAGMLISQWELIRGRKISVCIIF